MNINDKAMSTVAMYRVPKDEYRVDRDKRIFTFCKANGLLLITGRLGQGKSFETSPTMI